MTFIAYLLLRFGVSVVFLFASAPLLLGLFGLIKLSEAYESLRPLGFVSAVLMLAWFVANGWLVQRTANHMMFENKELGPAMRLSLLDARLRLCFLPVIGRWFTPKDNAEDDDQTKSRDQSGRRED